MLNKSPGGSVFPYYYKGGEIHCLKYGSFKNNSSQLFEIMKLEEEFIKKKERPLRIWVDFYETDLSDEVLEQFCDHIDSIKKQIVKLAIVGVHFFEKKKINHLLKIRGIMIRVKYDSDPEVAKTWLVGEVN